MKIISVLGILTATSILNAQTTNQFSASGSASTNAIIGSQSASHRVGQMNMLPRPFCQAATKGGAPPTYIIGDQGANYRVWQKVLRVKKAQGNAILTTNRAYVELASGLSYKDPATGKWLPSREEIDAYPGGAIAQHGQHKVIFANNLNTLGAIDLQTPDGKELRSDILGLGYYDTASGKSVLIAQVKDCQGQIVSSNQVLYLNAFNGVQANARYRYTRAGLEQDVILLAQPPAPESFGLSSGSSVLQLLTEFTSAPAPNITAISAPSGSGVELPDEFLNFGAMKMGMGQAFLVGQNPLNGVRIAKQWTTVNGRTVLVESLPVSALEQLAQLPVSTLTSTKPVKGSPQYVVSNRRLLPSPNMARNTVSRMELAKEAVSSRGFILDYQILNGFQPANYTFQGDTTYEISGPVTLSGTTIFEPGTVIKYAPGAQIGFSFSPSPNIQCQGTPYRPIIFTARDDDSIGEVLGDSTGNAQGYYANYVLGMGGPNLSSASYFRVLYASCGMSFFGGGPTLSNAQFVQCQTAFKFQSCPINVRNALFSHVSTVFYNYVNYGQASYSIQNVTFDNVGCIFNNAAGGYWPPLYVGIGNSIMANTAQITSGGNIYLSGGNNGFYNCPTTFGSSQISCTDDPFQTAGAGNYYLNDDPNGGKRFQGVGTASNFIKTKTTHPPIALPALMAVSGDLTLFPQVPRYNSGTADLGYYYDALDYTVATMILAGGNISVEPDTVIGVRNDYINDPVNGSWWTSEGFFLEQGSSFVSHGTPTAPNIFTAATMVQEQPQTDFAQYQDSILYYYGLQPANTVNFVTDFEPNPLNSPAPTLDFRFSKFYLTGLDCHIWAGFDEYDFYEASPDSSMFLNLRDCEIHGGRLNLGNPDYSYYDPSQVYASGAVSLFNNLFDRLTINLDPTYYWYNGVINCDMLIQAYNNLFHTGPFLHLEPFPATAGNWKFEDNLFDKVNFVQDVDCYGQGPSQPLDYDYNAYWPLTADELTAEQGNYPFTEPPNAAELQPTDTSNDGFTDGTPGNHEVILTATPPYQSGPLGNYYLPTTTPLYNAGSRSAADARLAEYTMQVNQAKDSGQVDIGLHYVATDSSTSASPLDTDSDGIPDYVEDANGNGQYDAGAETDWNDPETVDGTSDPQNSIYDYVDLDGDGLTGKAERLLGTNPLIPDNPLNITSVEQLSTLSGVATIPLQIDPNFGGSPGFSLFVDGAEANATIQKANGTWVAQWDTTTIGNGLHFINVRYVYDDKTDGSPDSCVGGSLFVDVENLLTPNPITRDFTDLLTIDAAVNINADSYIVDIFDADTGAYLATLSGPISNGQIETSWDLTDGNGTRIANNGLRCDFYLYTSSQGLSANFSIGPISIIYRLFDHIFGRQNFAIAWGFADYNTQSSSTAMNNNMLNSVVDNLNTLFDWYGDGTDYNLLPGISGNANVPYGSAFRWSNDSDRQTLITALQNSADFYWWGHGTEDDINPGGDAVIIQASDLEAAFQQTPNHKKHVFRLVILDSCHGYSVKMANAFGFTFLNAPNVIIPPVPKINYQNLQREPQAFVGWPCETPAPYTPNVSEINWLGHCQNLLFSQWQSGVIIQNCVQSYVNELEKNPPFETQASKSELNQWKISGCYDLQTDDR